MKNFQIIFPTGWSTPWERETLKLGYSHRLKIKVEERIYPVYFLTPDSVKRLEENFKEQKSFFLAKTNAIVIESVSIASIINCLERMDEEWFLNKVSAE